MAGFYASNSFCRMAGQLQESLRAANLPVRNFTFKSDKDFDTITPLIDCNQIVSNGAYTFIDRVYQKQIQSHPGSVWIVTDNVQDPRPQAQNAEDEDIRKFYKVLEQDAAVKDVHFFIRTPEFNGKLYKQDGVTSYGPYSGKRGLLVYGILLDSTLQAQFEVAMRTFASKSQEFADSNLVEGIQVKGFSSASITTEISKRDQDTHVVLRNSDNALIFQNVFREGEKIQGSFQMTFVSGPNNLVVSQPEVEVRLQEPFQLFVDGARFTATPPEVNSAPPRLSSSLLPATAKGTPQHVVVSVEFKDGVHFPHSPRYLWNYLWQPRASLYKGRIEVGVKARKADVDFLPGWVKNYDIGSEYFDSANEGTQKKIYGLKDLFKQLNSNRNDYVVIPARTIPVEFSASPPQWPVFVLGLFALMLIILSFLLLRKIADPEFNLEPLGALSYRLSVRQLQKSRRPDPDDWGSPDDTSDNGTKPVRLRFFSSEPLKEEDQRLGDLRRNLMGISVKAATGYVVNGSRQYRLSNRGGAFGFSKDEEQHERNRENGRIATKGDSSPRRKIKTGRNTSSDDSFFS